MGRRLRKLNIPRKRVPQRGKLPKVGTPKKKPRVRTVYLPAVNRHVTLASYVRTVRYAIANPDARFKHGLTTWWEVKGWQVRREFMRGMHERINQAVPYIKRGF